MITSEELDDDVQQRIAKYFLGPVADVCLYDKVFVMPSCYKESVNWVKNMKLVNGCIVQGGPRCGTTWLSVICGMIQNDLDFANFAKMSQNLEQFFLGLHPDSQVLGITQEGFASYVAKYPNPCIHTHMPLSFLPDDILEKGKVIHIVRDPRDVAVSFYHLSKGMKISNFNGDFKDFWKLFVAGEMWLTPFFPRVLQAWAQRNHPNMLFLFYEDMLEDLPSVVDRIMKFLGKQFSDERLEELYRFMNFNNWKNFPLAVPIMREDLANDSESGLFFRKGTSGQWREYFDEEMKQQAAKWMAENLAGSGMQDHLPKAWKEQ